MLKQCVPGSLCSSPYERLSDNNVAYLDFILLSYVTHMPVAFHLPPFHSDHAGSPIITNLSYNNQSQATTLTCTSTGGPATNVTWRRDGVVITLNDTHQQTKRLVDDVNGTYQTVLTIDPSVNQSDIVGTYNCTVANDRGESSETVVVPGETCSLASVHIHSYHVHPYIFFTVQYFYHIYNHTIEMCIV